MQTNHEITISFDNIKQVQYLDKIIAEHSPEENTVRSLFTGLFIKKKEVFTPEEKHFMRVFRKKLKEFNV